MTLYKRNPLAPPPPLRPLDEQALRALRELNDTPRAGSKRYGGAELHEVAEAMGGHYRQGRSTWAPISRLIAAGLAERLHGFDGIGDLVITEAGRDLLSKIESSRRFL